MVENSEVTKIKDTNNGSIGVYDKKEDADKEVRVDQPWPKVLNYECWLEKNLTIKRAFKQDGGVIGVFENHQDAQAYLSMVPTEEAPKESTNELWPIEKMVCD